MPRHVSLLNVLFHPVLWSASITYISSLSSMIRALKVAVSLVLTAAEAVGVKGTCSVVSVGRCTCWPTMYTDVSGSSLYSLKTKHAPIWFARSVSCCLVAIRAARVWFCVDELEEDIAHSRSFAQCPFRPCKNEICVDPSLCRGTSTRGWQLFQGHKDAQSLGLSHAWWRDDMWSCCATLYVLYLWVYCSHPPSVGWRFFYGQPKLILTLRKNHQSSSLEECFEIPIARLPNWFDPNAMTMTKLSTSFTATVCRTSILFFLGQPRSRSLHLLRTVALFFVEPVDCDGWVYALVGCSSCNRLHSLFAWAKSGRWLSGCWVLRAFAVRNQCFEFWILSALVATKICFPKAILSYNILPFSFHPIRDHEVL